MRPWTPPRWHDDTKTTSSNGRESTMVCYRCLRKVTTKDDIMFVATHPVHRGECPKRRKRKPVPPLMLPVMPQLHVPLQKPVYGR